MHLILQKIDFKQEYDEKKVREVIDKLVADKIIIEKEANAIDATKIVALINSDFAERIRNAKKIYKEKPFYMNIKALELFDEDIDEKILVQGIIDLYFVDKDGKIVLVDYKTDFAKDENELIDKYKKQLKIYKTAIETALDKKVDEVFIYSLTLNKPIKLLNI